MESEENPETLENENGPSQDKEKKPRLLRAAPTRNRFGRNQAKKHEQDQKKVEVKGNKESEKK